MNNPYCELVNTNTKFNNKYVYTCSYCGIKLGLDDPNTKMICFKKMQDYTISIQKTINPKLDGSIMNVKEGEIVQDLILGKTIKEMDEKIKIENNQNNPDNLCSQEQIAERMSICKKCEYYQDDTCMLCGCHVVREANHMNKLAHKDQACPAAKWGPII